MKKISYLVVCCTIALAVVSCKKEGCTDPTATNYTIGATKDDGSCQYANQTVPTAPTYNPVFAGTFGSLVALKVVSTTSTPIGNVDNNVGTAVAAFSENGGSSFVGAGTVKVNSTALSVSSNNAYYYSVSASNPTGIDYTASSSVNWEADGSTWPAFTASTSQGFATVGTITSGNPSTSASYTVTASSHTNADSTLFMLVGQSGNVMKIVGGAQTQYTFSASEVSSCGSGTGVVEVIGLKYDLQNIASKDYYLINETARTKTVTIE